MNIGMKLSLIEDLCKVNPLEEADTTSYFSSKHIMSAKELAGQVFGYLSHIITRAYRSTAMQIFLFPIQRNGLRIIVQVYGNRGYTCEVYAIARKNKICETLVNMFANGETDLTDIIAEYRGKLGYCGVPYELSEQNMSVDWIPSTSPSWYVSG